MCYLKWVLILYIIALLGSHRSASAETRVHGNDATPSMDVGSTESEGSFLHHLEVDGASVPLTDMGPVIINKDGTTRRISNWKILSKHEQERTWVRIKKRNAERLAVLKARLGDEADISLECKTDENELSAVVPALPTGAEDEEDMLAALAEIDALGLDLKDPLPKMPSMFK